MQPSRRAGRFLVSTLSVGFCFAMLACTPKIPDKVTAQEMDLYREWLQQKFGSKAPEHLYLDDQTFVFDPLRQEGCGKALHQTDDVSNSLMRALHNLGSAAYELDVSPKDMKLPWSYQILNVREFPRATQGLHVISFSRVAFASSSKEALFAVNDLCGLQCGSGWAVSATKDNGAWKFKDSATCRWGE